MTDIRTRRDPLIVSAYRPRDSRDPLWRERGRLRERRSLYRRLTRWWQGQRMPRPKEEGEE